MNDNTKKSWLDHVGDYLSNIGVSVVLFLVILLVIVAILAYAVFQLLFSFFQFPPYEEVSEIDKDKISKKVDDIIELMKR